MKGSSAVEVGIDAVGLAIPRRYLELADLAAARGVPAAKFTEGLGVRQMAVASPAEDSVALGATAARRLLDQTGVDGRRIGMLVVGTETSVDHAKPVASYIHGLLGLSPDVRAYDAKHACYGGTAALMACVNWLASGAAGDRVGMVVCTDVARYGLNTSGEPTQGAGAVALLVSREPRLVAIDIGVSGCATRDVHDFWRPHGRREALVDGKFSVDCYLDALAASYEGWLGRASLRKLARDPAAEWSSARLGAIVFHLPFARMAWKAYGRLRQCDRGRPVDEAAEAEATRAEFAELVAPSLTLAQAVGNSYTASLYLGLASLLQARATALASRRIGLFSYGSGCTSEFFSATVADAATARVAAMSIEEMMAARERIHVDEYERMMSLPWDETDHAPPMPGSFYFAGVREHRRVYARDGQS